MIYFIREGGFPDTAVKIGFTGSSPESRRTDLQTGNSSGLDIMWCIPGDVEVERLCQEFFKEFHIRGEWYTENDKFTKRFKWFSTGVRNICNDYSGEIVELECNIPAIKKWLSFEGRVGINAELCVIVN